VSPIRADDDPRVLLGDRACGCLVADACDALALPQKALHRAAFAQLGSSLNRRVNQQLIQHVAARRDLARNPVVRRRITRERKVAQVKGVAAHGRAVRAFYPLQQAPVAQQPNAAVQDHMSVRYIAGESAAFH
jgi:hypothetical protein